MPMKHACIPIISLIFMSVCFSLTAQNNYYITANQPESLIANAGNDTTVSAGQSVTLGGIPSAIHGYGNYIYNWLPSTFLNDQTAPNPVSTPTTTSSYTLTVTDSHGCTAQSTINIEVINGVSGPQNKPSIEIFPNPTSDVITILHYGKVRYLEIYNATGSLVFKKSNDANLDNSFTIDMNNFNKGLFIITLYTASEIYNERIINQ